MTARTAGNTAAAGTVGTAPDPVGGPAMGTLRGLRRAIDVIDDASLVLLATRGQLARVAGRIKTARGLPLRDPAREARVHARARALAQRLGIEPDTARAFRAVAVADACRRQGLRPDLGQCAGAGGPFTMAVMPGPVEAHPAVRHLLRWLPPPSRLAPVLRRLPAAASHQLLGRALEKVLATPVSNGDFEFMVGRRIGIEVIDLGLRWVIQCDEAGLRAGDGAAEATVRGTATDLLLLASRLEDADTLFFQRRLVLTGDVELGLTARNLLERLPWESVPLGIRIGLNRAARLASAAREAHHGRTA
ncbi:ubiquinone anaerobic biosynthesis accessory factor UbiT [Lysobacter sp. A3-1-A15]|uniref:ubiquinone anaerobic biosynthesis accessory factor UbiT n=1 Tax=Novilysobacter viscosus TaxID=3098602 RepID=UPI002EDAA479